MASWPLHKLPTYDRMRTTVSVDENGEQQLQKVAADEADFASYMDKRIFKTKDIPKDNEELLEKIRDRIDQAGVEVPTVEVQFENLTVKGKITVGSRALPTLWNTFLNFFSDVLTNFTNLSFSKQNLVILEGATGILKPGRMTLLMGPPGGGKSTFLRILSGERDRSLQIEGNIFYNGHKLNEFEPRRTASFTSQEDIHLPELTVKETFDYSARYQGTGSEYDITTQLLRKEKELNIEPEQDIDLFMKAKATKDTSHYLMTEYCVKLLGLDTCANTIIGDHMRRGVSGGEKKRVTIGEMMVGPAKLHFMDGISTGLDSSTTYQIVKCIGQQTALAKHTVLMSLLQPTPETYDLFDDVLLLWGSQVIYHGPREHVEQFFEGFGFKRPPRRAIVDFLQEVTSIKDQKQYWANKEQPYSFVSARQFAEGYHKSEVWRKMLDDVSTHKDRCRGQSDALAFNKWSMPQWQLWKISFRKELLLLKKNIGLEIFILFQLALIATVTTTIFLRTNLHPHGFRDAQLYGGALFIIVVFVAFSGWVEMSSTSLRLPTFTKFRELKFFPPWTWSLSAALVKVVINFVQALTFVGICYYSIGFTPEAGRFFRLLLLMTTVVSMASSYFRMIAGFAKVKAVAIGLGGFGIICFSTMGGLSIPRSNLRAWSVWAYWALPLSYAQNAVYVNEFKGSRWRKMLAGQTQHDTVGHRFIIWQGCMDRGYRFWLGVGAEIAFALIFNMLFTILITYQSPPRKSQPLISKELLDEWEECRTGEKARSRTSKISTTETGDQHNSPRTLSLAAHSSRRSRSSASSSRSSTASAMEPVNDENNNNNNNNRIQLPFDPYCVTFKNINYFVANSQSNRGEKLQLLRDVTGAFRPGVLTALIGKTGAGKTTLLDVLAGRKTIGNVEGDIRINGFPQNLETFTRIAAYCEQSDVHSPQVTVWESMVFSVWLRLQPEIDAKTRMTFALEVLNLVDLAPLKEALVGVPGQSGLSAEQRKRLTIAVELVSNPSIIFIDEPTTGLDARSAASVMRAVRNTVDTGRTVVCTIHQPSIDIFESFDEILLLKSGGALAYAGALGTNSQLMIDYFQTNTSVPHIRDGQNPCAWVLDITTQEMEAKLGVDFGEIYKNSAAFQDMKQQVEQLSTPTPGIQDITFPTRFAQPFWSQFLTCLWRQYWTYWRSPSYNLNRFVIAFGMGILYGTVHWGIGKTLDNERNIHSLLGVFFLLHGLWATMTCETMQPVLGAEKEIIYRERAAGLYSPMAYSISQALIELPYVAVATAIVHLLIYSMMRFPWEWGKFFLIYYFTVASQLTFTTVGLAASALAPNTEVASILCIIFTQMFFLFTEFTVPLPRMVKWWKWAVWANPLHLSSYGPMAVLLGSKSHDFLTTEEGQVMSVKHYADTTYVFKKSYLKFVGPLCIVYPLLFTFLYFIILKYVNHQKR